MAETVDVGGTSVAVQEVAAPEALGFPVQWPPAGTIMNFDPANPPKELWIAKCEVLKELERIEKRGWNDFHKYHYATESDIVDAIRPLCAKHGIDIGATLLSQKTSRMTYGQSKETILSVVKWQFTIKHISGGYEIYFIEGIATDTPPGDKAIYKASTGAKKYFINMNFMISSGDDPELEDEAGTTGAGAEGRKGGAARQGQGQGQSAGNGKPASKPAVATGPPEVRCADCKLVVPETTRKGDGGEPIKMTPAETVAFTKTLVGREVCAGCMKKAMAPAAAAAPAATDPNAEKSQVGTNQATATTAAGPKHEPAPATQQATQAAAQPSGPAPAHGEVTEFNVRGDDWGITDNGANLAPEHVGIWDVIKDVKGKDTSKQNNDGSKGRVWTISFQHVKPTCTTFSRTLAEHLSHGKGKMAILVCAHKDKYLNLTEVKQIGDTTFTENVPDIQVAADQQAGGDPAGDAQEPPAQGSLIH